jgi:hypothetical protein
MRLKGSVGNELSVQRGSAKARCFEKNFGVGELLYVKGDLALSFEIRGEFYNILNAPEWGGPNTTLGSVNLGSAASTGTTKDPHGIFNQANDARIGELTARINF